MNQNSLEISKHSGRNLIAIFVLSVFAITHRNLCLLSVHAGEYDLVLTSDTPIAEGTSITFNVTLLKDGRLAPTDEYQFRYKINDGFEKVRRIIHLSGKSLNRAVGK